MSLTTLKVSCEGDVRRLKVDLPTAMEQSHKSTAIYEAVAHGFAISVSSFCLLYEDDERDMCTLHASTVSDLLEHAGAGKDSSVIRLLLRKGKDCAAKSSAGSEQEISAPFKAKDGLLKDQLECGRWVWQPSLGEDAVRRLKAFANECTIHDIDVTTLSQCLLQALPQLAKLACWKQWKVDMRGAELRDDLLPPLTRLLDDLGESDSMAQSKVALHAYIDGSQPNNLGHALIVLLQAWSEQAKPTLEIIVRKVARDFLALLQLLFPRMFGQKLIRSAKHALMRLQEILAFQQGSSRDVGAIADLLIQSLPIMVHVAYWRQTMIDWRGIERRSDLITPLTNLAVHIHGVAEAAGCSKAMLTTYLEDTRSDCLGRFFYSLLQHWAEHEANEGVKDTLRACALDLAEILPVILPGLFRKDRDGTHMKRAWQEAFAAKGKGKHFFGGKAWKGKGTAKGCGIFSQGMGVEEQHADKHNVEAESDLEGQLKSMRVGPGASMKGKGHWCNALFNDDDVDPNHSFLFEGKGHCKGKGMCKGKAKGKGKGWAKGWGKGWWLRPRWGMDFSEVHNAENAEAATLEPNYVFVDQTE